MTVFELDVALSERINKLESRLQIMKEICEMQLVQNRKFFNENTELLHRVSQLEIAVGKLILLSGFTGK